MVLSSSAEPRTLSVVQTSGWLRRGKLLDGVLSAWAVVAIELCVICFIHYAELASVWEIRTGAFWLTPVALAVAGPLGLFGALLMQVVRQSEVPAARWALALTAGVSGALVGWGVGGGRHLAAFEMRAGFAALVGVVAGAVVLSLAPRVGRALVRRAGMVAAGAAVLIIALELANRFILPRLYPAFHWSLAACCLVLAPFVQTHAGDERPARPRVRALLLLIAALGVPSLLVVPSARGLARLDNFRFVLLERAPILGRVVEMAAHIAPPEPWNPAVDCGPGGRCAEPAVDEVAPGRAVDLRGRDLLLITVDALRADHVGAYGYSRPTTPNLDALAREGVLFEQAYTATPHTSYAVTSLMTGKYMRPLLLQGAGSDSDTWASLLRTYGYRTAGFYPPAVFFIDTPRFESFQKGSLGFEYVKIEFAEGEKRLAQVGEYLDRAPAGAPLFLWVHLFGPHEPYVAHPQHAFGDREIDRYDSEIAAADETLGALTRRFRALRPNAAVIVTADHGEEFGEHGGRYHGTTVYEEQLRVPLVVAAPGVTQPRRVREVVSTIDILPTVLASLAIPRPPRVRGRDLGALLMGTRPEEPGIAHGETDEHTLLARGSLRLICARRVGACKLYDLAQDPAQTVDVGSARAGELGALRTELRALAASHGRYESQGLRAEGKGWPDAIVRGLAGDGEVAPEVAALLDDVDATIRRKAAEVLVELRRPEAAAALRLALGRDEDPDVRKLAALALTRLGEGAPLVLELLDEPRYRRMAALALAESGDARGLEGLLEWWRDTESRDFTRSKQMLEGFAAIRAREAVPLLSAELEDVRLRPELAHALARIGDESARAPLVRAFANERSLSARVALANALVELGARYELAPSLVRFLGVPDPLPNGLSLATRARILAHIGGPADRDLTRLQQRSELGTRVTLMVPKGGNGRGLRAFAHVECPKSADSGELLLSSAGHLIRYDREGKLIPQRKVPELDATRVLRLHVPCTGSPIELHAPLPDTIPARAGATTDVIVFASRSVRVHAIAIVPFADELPPPAPRPWSPDASVGSN